MPVAAASIGSETLSELQDCRADRALCASRLYFYQKVLAPSVMLSG